MDLTGEDLALVAAPSGKSCISS